MRVQPNDRSALQALHAVLQSIEPVRPAQGLRRLLPAIVPVDPLTAPAMGSALRLARRRSDRADPADAVLYAP